MVPALTLARWLTQRDPGCACLAVSTARGVADQVWDRAAGELATVPVEPWPKWWAAADPRYWWRQGRAAAATLRLLRRFRPHVVVGFGGAVAGPAVLLAKLSGTPTVIHEQNLFPGRTTRLLASWADRVAVSFEETRRHLPPTARIAVTGNPVRPEVEQCVRETASAALGLTPGKPVLVIMGGSQGAHLLNVLSVEAVASLTPAQHRAFQVVHLTGPGDCSWVTERYRALGVTAAVHAFLPAVGPAYAAATVAVARAGATTVAELVATATPSVLVPYPYARGHQMLNAEWLSRHGGAVLVPQESLTPARWRDAVWPLLTEPARAASMRAVLRSLAAPGAAGRLAETVLEVARAA